MKITGIIKNQNTKEPLTKAQIVLSIGSQELVGLYSVEEGYFECEISDEYKGQTLSCKAEKDGFITKVVEKELNKEEIHYDIELEEEEDKVELKINLKDKKLKPLGGVKISLEADGEQIAVGFTDPSGLFSITISSKYKDKTISYKAELEGVKVSSGKIRLEGKTIKEIRIDNSIWKKLIDLIQGMPTLAKTMIIIIAVGVVLGKFLPLPNPNGNGGPPPEILSFEAMPHQIARGGESTIKWNTINATKVTIEDNGIIKEFEPVDSTIVTPEETTTYILVAENDSGEKVRERVRVEVEALRPPIIDYFEAEPKRIVMGGSSTLRWGTSNATRVTIEENGVINEVGASGTPVVTPKETTTYVLVAENEVGQISTREVQVVVIEPTNLSVTEFACVYQRDSLAFTYTLTVDGQLDDNFMISIDIEKEKEEDTPIRVPVYEAEFVFFELSSRLLNEWKLEPSQFDDLRINGFVKDKKTIPLSNLKNGNYIITIKVDCYDSIEESNENDNTSFDRIEVWIVE